MLYETSLVTTVSKIVAHNNQAVSSQSGIHTPIISAKIEICEDVGPKVNLT